MRFTTNDQVLIFWSNSGQGIIGVNEAPVMEGGAVVIIGPGVSGNAGVEVEPLALTTVQVLYE